MTLGTNATLEERLFYAPEEVNQGEIIELVAELELYRELLDTEEYGPDDLKERIEDLENQVGLREGDIKELESMKDDLETKVYHLENLVEELEIKLAEMESNPAP